MAIPRRRNMGVFSKRSEQTPSSTVLSGFFLAFKIEKLWKTTLSRSSSWMHGFISRLLGLSLRIAECLIPLGGLQVAATFP